MLYFSINISAYGFQVYKELRSCFPFCQKANKVAVNVVMAESNNINTNSLEIGRWNDWWDALCGEN